MKHKEIIWLLPLVLMLVGIFFQSCKNDGESPTSPIKEEVQKFPPVAEFTANPLSGEAPLQVAFDASASSDTDGQIINYSWIFGDNSSAGSGVKTNHTYQKEGSYTIKLLVMDNDSSESSRSVKINVTAPPGPKLFPMYLNAKWTYSVKAYYKSISENSGSTETGTINVKVTYYDPENLIAKLSSAEI